MKYRLYPKFVLLVWVTFALLLAGSLYVHLIYFGKEQINAGYMQQGKKIYQQAQCAECHGDEGNTPLVDDFPTITNQSHKYLLVQMQDIKSGARNNGGSAQMRPFLKQLDNNQLSLIAYYLANK